MHAPALIRQGHGLWLGLCSLLFVVLAEDHLVPSLPFRYFPWVLYYVQVSVAISGDNACSIMDARPASRVVVACIVHTIVRTPLLGVCASDL